MKYYLSFFQAILCCYITLAQDEPSRQVPSHVHDVVVHMAGAELHHTATVRLTAGKQELVFSGLSHQLEEHTLLVDIQKKDVTILSVTSRTNYMDPIKNNDRIMRVQDSLNLHKDKIEFYDTRINGLVKEKDLLYKNESIGGTSQGVAVSEIAKAADFFRQRIWDIEDELIRYRKLKAEHHSKRQQLDLQLNELNATYNPPTSEVRIVVMSPTATETNFSIKYQVPEAGWAPKYDVRSEGITQPVELIYRANIYNNSGLDWENVHLKLSTADPNQGAEKPNLESWDLGEVTLEEPNYNSPVYKSEYDKEDSRVDLNAVMITSKDLKIKQRNTSSLVPSSMEVIEVAELSAEFNIPQPYTILSDAKPYIVEVSKHQLQAKYEHFCVPKMDVDAFLIAKVSGWTALNLVSGKASVYYGGAYLGDSYINTASVEDTLVLSMGRDKKITITRMKKTEESKKINSGNGVKERFVFETTIRNNREVPVTINMEDQVPISTDKEIQITEDNLSGGNLDKYSGKVNYIVLLQPGESKKITMAYTVKSPRNRAIRGSKNVRRARAKF